MTDLNTTTPTNTPEQHSVLIDSIGKYLVGMIEGIVERRVNSILETHATLKLLDEKTELRITQIVEELIDEHVSDYDHTTTDEVSDMIATHIAHTDFTPQVESSVRDLLNDGDYTDEDRVRELIDEHDFEESVKEVLRNI